MFNFPKTLHPLYLFEEDSAFYAVDLETATIIKLSAVMRDILKLAETQTSDRILQTLKTSYAMDDIFQAFERFAELEKAGLLFNRGENLKETGAMARERRKLLVAIPGIAIDSLFNIDTLAAGTNIALSYMLQHLTKHVDLHFIGNRNRKLADNLYEVDMSVADFGRLSRSINETYFGILTLHRDHETWLLPLYQHIEPPPIFCRRYNPQTHQTTSKAYRLGINRYEHLEKALEETLLKQHKATEVEAVFKHFQPVIKQSDPPLETN